MLEDLLPDPGFGPPSEPAMGILPVAQALRQIAPRDAGAVAIEHRLDEATIVLSGRPTWPIRPGSQSLIRSHWSSRSPYRVIGQPFAKANLPLIT